MIYGGCKFKGISVPQETLNELIEAIVEVHDIINPNQSLSPLDIANRLGGKGYRIIWNKIGDGARIDWVADVHRPMGM